MRTDSDLREAYDYLAGTASTADVLHLPHTDRAPARERRRSTFRVAVAAIAVVALVATMLTVTHTRSTPRHNQPPASHPLPTNFPKDYLYGPTSLPGYSLSVLALQSTGQHFDFVPNHPPRGATVAAKVSVDSFTPTAAQLAALSSYPHVKVGTAAGYYGPASAVAALGSPGPDAVFWKASSDQWVGFIAYKKGVDVELPRAEQLTLASTLVARPDRHVALVKLGYLPPNLRFDYAAQYVNQGTMLAADDTTGSGYRILALIDRSLPPEKHSTLDISSTTDPTVPLTAATVNDLPSMDQDGPWTKTTVRGHLAWISPHSILIQWGALQIGVSSFRTTDDASTPLLSQAELLKVANSLTVPTTVAIGTGYPLAGAVPPAALH